MIRDSDLYVRLLEHRLRVDEFNRLGWLKNELATEQRRRLVITALHLLRTAVERRTSTPRASSDIETAVLKRGTSNPT